MFSFVSSTTLRHIHKEFYTNENVSALLIVYSVISDCDWLESSIPCRKGSKEARAEILYASGKCKRNLSLAEPDPA